MKENENNTKVSKTHLMLALCFGLLTLCFIAAMILNHTFFEWVFERHQNQWSWYIRPLFVIPFCYFAYKHNWIGISVTVFALFTSMFWFRVPEIVSPKVQEFLQFEKEWLFGIWNVNKVLLVSTVPLSFIALGVACWKRSLIIGLSVIVLMATGKIIWSLYNAGESAQSIIVPAVIGLGFCCASLLYGYKKSKKNDKT